MISRRCASTVARNGAGRRGAVGRGARPSRRHGRSANPHSTGTLGIRHQDRDCRGPDEATGSAQDTVERLGVSALPLPSAQRGHLAPVVLTSPPSSHRALLPLPPPRYPRPRPARSPGAPPSTYRSATGAGAPALRHDRPADRDEQHPAATASTPPRRSVMGFALRSPSQGTVNLGFGVGGVRYLRYER
jgi:hypothetical protein